MPDETRLIERVRDVIAEFVKKDVGDVAVSEIKGGFTGASKFKADNFFLKVADTTTRALDAFLVESEANIYSLFKRLKLTGLIFPEYVGLVDRKGLKVLIVEFLSQVTWGGPWNYQTIEFLDKSLEKLHSTKMSDSEISELTELSDAVRKSLGQKTKKESIESKDQEEKNKPFFEAWDSKESGFRNAAGEIYFMGVSDFPKIIVDESLNDLSGANECLIMHDLNFANIGFNEHQAYFVDPLFATVGNPIADRTVVGVNILQQLGQSVEPQLRKFVIDRFLNDRVALSRLTKYYVIASAMKLDKKQSGWQKFHQECAAVSLSILKELF